MDKHEESIFRSAWNKARDVNTRIMERSDRWRDIHRSGGADVSEYIKADFGGKNPNGLDVDEQEKQFIKLESTFASSSFKEAGLYKKIAGLRCGGWVQHNVKDTISLNPIYYSEVALKVKKILGIFTGEQESSMADIIPHEFVHTRQHASDHSGWLRRNRGNDIEYVGVNDLSAPQQMWRKASRLYQNVSVGAKTRADTIGNYYARNVEMQARLHEIMAYGYTQWQVLPTNKIELQAALHNLGVKTPESVLKALEESEEGQAALQYFTVMPSLQAQVLGTVNTFNRIHKYIGERDVQEGMWEVKYPVLYCELLEFYGDKLGRERLGLGVNPKPAISALIALKNHEGELTVSHANELVKDIPAPLSAALLNSIIFQTEYLPKEEVAYSNAMVFSRALLGRDDVRQELFEGDKIVRNFVSENEFLPLDTALKAHNLDMIEILMEAGADPFQRYDYIDMRGKRMFVGCPLDIARHALCDQKALAEPAELHKKARKYFEGDENRERIKKFIAKATIGLEKMLECSQSPDAQHSWDKLDPNGETVSLRELISKLRGQAPVKNNNAPSSPTIS